jgi:hypothetical protein
MNRSLASPTELYQQKNWVHEYLQRDDDSLCDAEIRDAFDSLQDTVSVMFDKEIAKKVREIERKGYHAEASFIPVKHHKHEPKSSSESESESDLRPKPLFSGRRTVTYGGYSGSDTSSSPPTTSSGWSPNSSCHASSPITTTATTTSTRTSPRTPVLSQEEITYSSDARVTPFVPRKSLVRDSDTGRTMFPPRRSSLSVKVNMQAHAHSDVPPTPARHADRYTQPPMRCASAAEPRRVTTHPSGNLFSSNLNLSGPLPPYHVEAGNAMFERAITMTQVTPSRQPSREQNISSSMVSSSPFTKPWAPPVYTPTRTRNITIPQATFARDYENFQRKMSESQEQPYSCKRSASTLSLADRIADSTGSQTATEQDDTAHDTERKDSFGLVGTSSKLNSPLFKVKPKNSNLTVVIPQRPTTVPEPLGLPRPEQMMIEVEDGIRALRYVEDPYISPKSAHSALSIPIKGQSSIRRIASAATGQLQKHLSQTFLSNNERRNSMDSRRSSSTPSWFTVPFSEQSRHSCEQSRSSSKQFEIIVDPNGLLTHPHLHCPRHDAMASASEVVLQVPSFKPLRTKRLQVEVVSQSSPSSVAPNHRFAMEQVREPVKALHVLGSFNALVKVEALEEKERKRAKKKRRFNDILEVASKALELG